MRPKDDEGLCEEELNRLKRKMGELTTGLDIAQEALRQPPLVPGTSEE